MKKERFIKCLDFSIFNAELNDIVDDQYKLITTINQYSYCITKKDAAFKKALMHSDVLLPDGIGIVLASKVLNSQKINKIAGADLHTFFLEKLNHDAGSCFYLGASKATLAKIEKRMAVDYPRIKIGSFSPPFKSEFSEKDSNEMIAKVNAFQPDVLFVGMTAPKQEKWSYQFKDRLDCKKICAIGAVFDFYAGTVERPNKVWISLGLEWLGRLIKEPKRMWRRYIYYGVIFAVYLGKEKLKLTRPNKIKAGS